LASLYLSSIIFAGNLGKKIEWKCESGLEVLFSSQLLSVPKRLVFNSSPVDSLMPDMVWANLQPFPQQTY